MRVLTEEETSTFFEKLAKYLGANIKFLLEREDNTHVFRLHRNRIYYLNAEVLKMAAHFPRDELLAAGTIFGKFTKGGLFRLAVTGLDFLAKYARHKVWVKPNGE